MANLPDCKIQLVKTLCKRRPKSGLLHWMENSFSAVNLTEEENHRWLNGNDCQPVPEWEPARFASWCCAVTAIVWWEHFSNWGTILCRAPTSLNVSVYTRLKVLQAAFKCEDSPPATKSKHQVKVSRDIPKHNPDLHAYPAIPAALSTSFHQCIIQSINTTGAACQIISCLRLLVGQGTLCRTWSAPWSWRVHQCWLLFALAAAFLCFSGFFNAFSFTVFLSNVWSTQGLPSDQLDMPFMQGSSWDTQWRLFLTFPRTSQNIPRISTMPEVPKLGSCDQQRYEYEVLVILGASRLKKMNIRHAPHRGARWCQRHLHCTAHPAPPAVPSIKLQKLPRQWEDVRISNHKP